MRKHTNMEHAKNKRDMVRQNVCLMVRWHSHLPTLGHYNAVEHSDNSRRAEAEAEAATATRTEPTNNSNKNENNNDNISGDQTMNAANVSQFACRCGSSWIEYACAGSSMRSKKMNLNPN